MTATVLPPGDLDVARDALRARIRGVNEALPAGERILWEGAPDARALARHLFFVRPITVYLSVMVLWWVAVNVSQAGTTSFWVTLATQVLLSGGVVVSAWLFARAIARGTTYAITDRRLVLNFGVIFPMTINLPLRYVEAASARQFSDSTGQIAVHLRSQEKLAWIVLFPHVRTWKFNNPEPLLRGLTDPHTVGEILREAVLNVPPAEAS